MKNKEKKDGNMDKYARYDAQAGFFPMRPQEILTGNPIGYI